MNVSLFNINYMISFKPKHTLVCLLPIYYVS